MVRRGRTKKAPRSSPLAPYGSLSARRSVMGQLMPPVDVTSASQFGELDRRVAMGPITLVFVYAPWCGHCTRFKPTMDALEKTPNRSVQIARVRDDVYPNTALASKNKVESYPSLLLVDKEGNATKFKSASGEISNSIPNYKEPGVMEAVVKNMGTPEGLSLVTNANAASEPLGEAALTAQGTPTALAINNKAMWTAASKIRSPSPTPEQIPQNVVADRMTTENVNRLNTMLSNSQNALLKKSTEGTQIGGSATQGGGFATQGGGFATQGGGSATQMGGKRSLFASLTMAAKNLAPATTLLLGAQIMRRRTKRATKTRRGRKRRT